MPKLSALIIKLALNTDKHTKKVVTSIIKVIVERELNKKFSHLGSYSACLQAAYVNELWIFLSLKMALQLEWIHSFALSAQKCARCTASAAVGAGSCAVGNL